MKKLLSSALAFLFLSVFTIPVLWPSAADAQWGKKPALHKVFKSIPKTFMYVCIKAPNNKHFVTAEGNKKSVNANRPRCRGWEKFLIIAANKKSRIINSGDKVYIKTGDVPISVEIRGAGVAG